MKVRNTCAAALAALALGTAATAATITAGSNGIVIATPAAVTNDGPASVGVISSFNEITGLTLADGLQVADGRIDAGTRVDSHMFFLNRATPAAGRPKDRVTATFTFSQDILGFITGKTTLTRTDSLLGAPGTFYEPFSARGIERDDILTLNGPRSFTASLVVAQPGDWFRVVTASAPVPSVAAVPLPAAAPLLLAGLGAFGLMRRRKTRRA